MSSTELSEVVNRLLADRIDLSCVISAERDRWPGGDAVWRTLEELGLTLVDTPESLGGSGGDILDAAEVLLAAGRFAVPLPLAETAFVAAAALVACDMPVPSGQLTIAGLDPADELSVAPASPSTVTGKAYDVPWGGRVDTIVVVANDDQGRPFVGTVHGADARSQRRANVAGEPRDDLTFTTTALRTCTPAPEGLREDVFRRLALARALQMLGALEQVQALTLQYAKDRNQFGRPIAKFQAVAQQLARLAADVAVARAGVEVAVDAAARTGQAPEFEIAAAKVVCGIAARTVTAVAHQVHGAIGVTQEYPLHVLTRRLWAWQDEGGSERYWSERLGRLVRSEPGAAWPLIAATVPRMPQ